MRNKLLFIILLTSLLNAQDKVKTGNVIFIHPDGTGLSIWNAMRVLYYGPDSESNWDKLPSIGLYQSHLKNTLQVSSNAGGTIHAYGVKADYHAFGLIEGKEITSRSGKKLSIMEEAKQKGIAIGIINSGILPEPGTACFLASVNERDNYDEITKQLIESGAEIIFGGGEKYLLPDGISGIYTKSGVRKDGLNLIEMAKGKGYNIIYNREELKSLPDNTKKVLGVFSENHTFNDQTEEDQRNNNLKNYNDWAPTLAEMTEAALKILSKHKQFFVMIEEEGTDNFQNKNNAKGALEALKRADDAIGVSLQFLKKHPNTMILTAADSDAGGMELIGLDKSYVKDKNAPEKDSNGAPYDGINGTGSEPFISKPDKAGNTFPFVISWASATDVFGDVVAKAAGLNSNLMKGKIDNTDMYKFIYATLFGKILK